MPVLSRHLLVLYDKIHDGNDLKTEWQRLYLYLCCNTSNYLQFTR